MAAVEKSEQNEFVREKIEAFKERFRSRLTIKRWPPNSIPPSVFRSWLHQLRDMGRICLPGRMTLILCDYPQLFLPQRRNDRREQEIRTNYQAMLQIADEFNCPVWGAVQATRQGSEKVQSRGPSYPKKSMYARNADPSAPTGKFLTTTDIGECFAVAADADVIVTNNQNLDEHARKEIRMGLAKVRDAEDGRMVLAEVEYEYMRLHEKEPSSMTGLARRRDRKAEQEKEEANEVAN
jgi:hypothetical protein